MTDITIDEIKSLSDEELREAIAVKHGWEPPELPEERKYAHWKCPRTGHWILRGYWPRWPDSLDAAWPLQFDASIHPPDFVHAMRLLADKVESDVFNGYYPRSPGRCARLICEAWLWLKTKGEK